MAIEGALSTYGIEATKDFLFNTLKDELKDQIFESVTGLPSIYRSGFSLMKAGIKSSTKTVLGHMEDEYWKYADEIGASRFHFSDAEWDEMIKKGCDPWELNLRFLDKIAEKGDDVLIRAERGIRPGSTLEKEVDYLRSQLGYDWKDDTKTVLTKIK